MSETPESNRFKLQKNLLKKQTQLVRELLLKEGFLWSDAAFPFKNNKTGTDVDFTHFTSALYVDILRLPDAADISRTFRRTVKYTIVNGSQKMIYKLAKNTNWGYVDMEMDEFQSWFDALKHSLNQTDDLAIVEHLRDRQTTLLKQEQEKVRCYEEIIARLKREQKDAVAFESAMGEREQKEKADLDRAVERGLNLFKETILNRPHFPPKVGPERPRINRRNQLKMLPYPVVLSEDKDGPVLKRASKGPPAKNLRPRRVPAKK